MTDSAATLEDLSRWLGVVITLLGALVINPAASEHFVRGIVGQGGRGSRRVCILLARFIPWLRRDMTIQGATGTGAALRGTVTGTARGIAGWAVGATVDQKLDVLEARTQVLHEEVGELQTALRKAEKQLKRDLARAVHRLRSEANEIRDAVDAFRQETVNANASALPVIVVGVVLAGLAPDAARFQVWAWLLFLTGLCAYAIRRSWQIFRKPRG